MKKLTNLFLNAYCIIFFICPHILLNKQHYFVLSINIFCTSSKWYNYIEITIEKLFIDKKNNNALSYTTPFSYLFFFFENIREQYSTTKQLFETHRIISQVGINSFINTNYARGKIFDLSSISFLWKPIINLPEVSGTLIN